MTLNECLTLVAIVLGPIVAVCITLWIEGRRRKRESRVLILRQLMITRHLAGDPNYSAAVNLIPVEFNDEPNVLAAYKAYQDAIRLPNPPADGVADRLQFVISKQTKMISAIMRTLSLKGSEADLPVEAYAANAMIIRDNLYLDSLRAQLRIADALERSVAQ